MERLRRINEKIVSRYNLDKFAVQQICKRLAAHKSPYSKSLTYEYRIGEEWIPGPPSRKPTGKRAVVEQYDYEAAKAAYLAWEEISKRKQFATERPEEVMSRLMFGAYTTQEQPLVLFVPWGVRPKGKPRFEERVIDMIADFRDALQEKNISTGVIFMPADVYAIEINQINPDKANAYFDEVSDLAYEREFIVKPWSEIRDRNRQVYEKRAAQLTPKAITEMLGQGKVMEAFDTAKRRSGFSTRFGIERAAFAYLRERITEAEIIEASFKPIKVSAVAKNKDNDVDRDLPRVYIIPEQFQFPWLK